MKEKVALGIFILLSLALLFIATTGIATSESNKNRAIINSLIDDINTLKQDIEQLNKTSNDTIVVDVKVNPQIIKIYNRCTN